jgi:hypothetical protein
LGGWARAAVPVPGKLSARGWRTVREELHSWLFVMFFASSCVALFRYVVLVVFGWSRFAELSAWGCRTGRASRTVRWVATDCPLGGHKLSVFRGAVLVVRVAFLYRPR